MRADTHRHCNRRPSRPISADRRTSRRDCVKEATASNAIDRQRRSPGQKPAGYGRCRTHKRSLHLIREYFAPLGVTGIADGARLYRPVQKAAERVTLMSSSCVRRSATFRPESLPATAPTSFEGFAPLQSNTTYCPNQFFDVALPHFARGVVRLVGYVIYRTFAWSDRDGRPISEQHKVSYRELTEEAGISREPSPK
jgi:hypothetical protein